MAISSITLAELLHGAEKSTAPEQTLVVVEDFCSRLEVLTYGPEAAQHYGSIRANLEKIGKPIGVNDLHSAAHARSEGLKLVCYERGLTMGPCNCPFLAMCRDSIPAIKFCTF